MDCRRGYDTHLMTAVDIVYRYTSAAAEVAPMPGDSAAAQARLEAGNRAFAALLDGLETRLEASRHIIPLDARDVGLLAAGATPPQHPYAAVLGCADARVPAELIFSEGPNELFVVRVAGNVLGQEVLGSLRYAALNLQLQAVVVLGHSECGAVRATVDLFEHPIGMVGLATDHGLRAIVSPLTMVMQAATRVLEAAHGPDAKSRPGWRAALVEMTVALNAASVAYALRRELGGLGASPIRVLHGVYVIGTRHVVAPDPAGGERQGLAEPPPGQGEFAATFAGLAVSPRIRAMLAQDG